MYDDMQQSLNGIHRDAATEFDSILDAWRAGDPGAILATVIDSRGSVERGAGSRVLLGASAGPAYTAMVREFDMTSGAEAVEAFGIDFDGRVRVWMEALTTPGATASIEFLDRCQRESREAVVATIIDTGDCARIRPGDRLFVTAEGTSGNMLGTPLERELLRVARVSLSERKSRLVFLGDCEVWIEWAGGPKPLVIFGSGVEAEPFVTAAIALGFTATGSQNPSGIAAGVSVLLLPNQEDAGETMAAILARKPRLLAMLEPKGRAEQQLREMAYDPVIHRMHAPADDLMAVIAEIQAALRRADREVRDPPTGMIFVLPVTTLPEPASQPA